MFEHVQDDMRIWEATRRWYSRYIFLISRSTTALPFSFFFILFSFVSMKIVTRWEKREKGESTASRITLKGSYYKTSTLTIPLVDNALSFIVPPYLSPLNKPLRKVGSPLLLRAPSARRDARIDKEYAFFALSAIFPSYLFILYPCEGTLSSLTL